MLGCEKLRRAVGRLLALSTAAGLPDAQAQLLLLEGAIGSSATSASAQLSAGQSLASSDANSWITELPAEDPEVWEAEGISGVVLGQTGVSSMIPSRMGMSCEVAANLKAAI